MPAAHLASPARGRARLIRALAVPAALALAACSASSGGSGATATATVTASAPAASSSASGAPASPAVVAVTAGGALEVLNPATGAVESRLVASGVIGDEVAVSANDTVYFATARGCTGEIESVPLAGGTPAEITAGQLPALSPDGTRLAVASEPSPRAASTCFPPADNTTSLYKVVVRTLSTGAQVTYPAVPPAQDNALPEPVSHLSWSPDSQRLAVSVGEVQDNEGWNLTLVSTAVAHFFLSGAGISYVAATGQPTPQRSYLQEGIYLPDGNLFVSRACCAGDPERNTSRLMWEVSPSGVLVHQVAIGFATLDHDSLAASPDGRWLLYIGGSALYVSQDGATPRQLASGLIAAAFV